MRGFFIASFFYFSNPLLYLCSKCIIQTSVNMGFFSFFSKEKKETLDKGLSKTKESVFSKIARAVAGKSKVDDEVLDNLEEVLITSDVGVETTLNIIKRIEKRAAADKYVNTQELNLILRDEIAALLTENNSDDVAVFGDIEGCSDAIQIGKMDLDALRNKLGVPETDTIAVGKTDVKGLENIIFEGQSPKVRNEAGLPDLDEICAGRNIKAPGTNPLFTRHAEEVLANDFDRAVIEAGINPQDVSGVLKIHQSNPTGVCRKCIQGLANDNVSPGVLKQLSLKYPNLRIEVTSEILPDIKVTGKSSFIIQNGKYVE